MDLDEDLFADNSKPGVNHGRGRFQPRAKPKPRKEATASVSSSLMINSKEKDKALTESLPSFETSHSPLPVDVSGGELANPVGSCGVISAVPETKEPLENNEEQRSGIPILSDQLKLEGGNPLSETDAMRDEVGSIEVLSTEVQGKCDGHSSQNLLTNEADSVKFDLDTSVNVNLQPTARNDPFGLSFATLETVGAKKYLKGDAVFANAIDLEVAVSDECGDLHTSSKNAVGDMLSGVECLDKFCNQSTHETETPALVDSDNNEGGENAGIQGQSSIDISTSRVCDTAHSCPDLFMAQDPVTCSGVSIFDNDGSIPVDGGRFETEVQQPRAFPDLDNIDFISEATVAPGSRAGKYKPKPKVRTEKEIADTSIVHPDAAESVMPSPTAQFFPSETECMPGGLVPVLPPEHEFDYSSIDLGDIIDPATSELPTNGELTNLAETFHAEATTSGDMQPEDVHGIAENLSCTGRKRKASIMSINQRSNESSLIGEDTKGGKSSRQLRKRAAVPQLVDEPADEAHDDSNFIAEHPGSNVDEDEGNVDGYSGRSKSQTKRASKRSKKSTAENEKCIQKSRKAKEASELVNKDPPKKFPHSTRRKRRRVSKELLETPEDEIDPQKVPLKDLILLAEYRERLAIKEAKSSTTPMTNQSTENIFGEEDYRDEEEETFASEQGYGSNGTQAPCRVRSSSLFFNYQSFMKKTPTVRWSKQDTELFYEAVRQFGTDLSMIQQLFPGRTRQQIKLKYKKEERNQPFRLTEALTNRAKDHSHFEKVIEHLQQFAAQKEQDANGEDSEGMAGEEVEDLTTEKNDEAGKVEQDKSGKVEQDKDGKADVAEIHSPPNADEIDDDDIWDSYKNEF